MGVANMQMIVPYEIKVHGESTYEFEDAIKEFIKASYTQEVLKTIGIPIEYYDNLIAHQDHNGWSKDMVLYNPKNASKFTITDIKLEEHYMKVTIPKMTIDNVEELAHLRVSCPLVSKDEEGKTTIHFLHFVI
jgi:hypothetical protein